MAAAGAVPPGAKVITYVVQSVSTWTDAAAGNVLRPQIAFKFQLDGNGRRLPQSGDGHRADPGLRRLAQRLLRVRGAAGRDGGARRLQRLGQRLRPEHLERHRHLLERRLDHHPHRRRHAHRARRERLLHAPARPARSIPANATMLTGGIGYTYALGSRQSPANPDLDFVNNTQPFTQIDLPAYPYVPNKKADGVTPGYGGVGGLIVPPPDVSMVATGFTGPARHRRQQQVRRLPRVAGRRARLPRRPAQRRRHVQLVPPPEPDQQRLVGQPEGLRPRHPRRREAHDAVHLARGVAPPRASGRRPTRACSTIARCATCPAPTTSARRATTAAYPNMLASTVGQGTYAAGSVHAPFVAEGTNYGVGFSYNALTGATANRRSDHAGDLADRRGLRRLPRLADRDRSHADQRRLVLRAAQHRLHQAAAGGVPALPRAHRGWPPSPPVHAFTP